MSGWGGRRAGAGPAPLDGEGQRRAKPSWSVSRANVERVQAHQVAAGLASQSAAVNELLELAGAIDLDAVRAYAAERGLTLAQAVAALTSGR